ncbi:Thioesterase/thiol ester dehydrase-isomerase [Choiromyces venosus 120613-1]|uniref:Thioesterase/thiol ester dehydrase-isomerase n=1 Tax=Choiromyces venosus 120613-1 TaxID=1336337 RepID=A0A3N4J059_9PEZI|nr:Thioesterase/thiol ester dehydrase-isomerase [Choiromyces venosus 120613-1]
MTSQPPWISKTLTPVQKINTFFDNVDASLTITTYDANLRHNELTLLSAASEPAGTSTFEFTVAEAHTNRMGNLHGGCAALIFDVCTTTALLPVAREGFWDYAGVTRSLNISYLRPAPTGTVLLIRSEVVHAGRKLATIKGVISRKDDGKVCYTAEHLKVNIPVPNL